MSQSGTEIHSVFELFSGGTDVDHPRIVVQNISLPFTLLPGEMGAYTLTFTNPLSATVRVYVKGLSDSSQQLWADSYPVGPGHNSVHYMHFNAQQLSGSTQLWMGSWWDDGTYRANAEGVAAYFAAHPGGVPEHHTVPILVG